LFNRQHPRILRRDAIKGHLIAWGSGYPRDPPITPAMSVGGFKRLTLLKAAGVVRDDSAAFIRPGQAWRAC
jgi:hypothetical protein